MRLDCTDIQACYCGTYMEQTILNLRYGLGTRWFVLPRTIILQSSIVIINQLLCSDITDTHHESTFNLSRKESRVYLMELFHLIQK